MLDCGPFNCAEATQSGLQKIKDRSNDRGELTPTDAATPVSTAEGAPAEEEAERKILYTVEELQAPRGLATGFS